MSLYILQRLPLTRSFEGFFSVCLNLIFHGRQSTVSMVFSMRSDREGSLIAEWRVNNFERRRLFKIILLRWRITLLKQTRSLRAEWNSRNILYSLHNGFQVVYLFDVWKHGSRGRLNCQEASINSKKQKISHRKGKKFPLNWGCFWKWILLLIILHVIE